MTLRSRIAVTAATAVAVAVVLAFLGLYVVTARTLVEEVDRSLTQLVADAGRALRDSGAGPGGLRGGVRPGPFGGAGGYVRAVDADGTVLGDLGDTVLDLPVTDRALAVAAGEAAPFLETVVVDSARFRLLTTPVRGDVAVQVARPLAEVDATLATLRRRLVLSGLFGIGLAGLLGAVVARRAVRPVERLTGLAEEVTATGDLSRRVDVPEPHEGGPVAALWSRLSRGADRPPEPHEGGPVAALWSRLSRGADRPLEPRTDEVGRLASTFNAMLAALEQARSAQEQLVADASHELRTPLTSLRTNIEVLAAGGASGPAAHRALLDDVVVQLDEFGRLVAGLVELARGDRPARGAVPVRLDELVDRVVARVRTHDADGATIDLWTEPTTVVAESDRVERAVANLVDNAVTHGGGGPVEVRVAAGKVVVRDHGPGVAEQDLPHVFDRFYRAAGARSAAGSGLGLAIVWQVAAAHGGTVTAANARGGGAVLTLTLPTHDDGRPRGTAVVRGGS